MELYFVHCTQWQKVLRLNFTSFFKYKNKNKTKECKKWFCHRRTVVLNVLIHALLDLGVYVFTLRISILRWKILVFGGNSRITGHQNMLGNLPHCHNCPLIPAEIKSCPLEFKGKWFEQKVHSMQISLSSYKFFLHQQMNDFFWRCFCKIWVDH